MSNWYHQLGFPTWELQALPLITFACVVPEINDLPLACYSIFFKYSLEQQLVCTFDMVETVVFYCPRLCFHLYCHLPLYAII